MARSADASWLSASGFETISPIIPLGLRACALPLCAIIPFGCARVLAPLDELGSVFPFPFPFPFPLPLPLLPLPEPFAFVCCCCNCCCLSDGRRRRVSEVGEVALDGVEEDEEEEMEIDKAETCTEKHSHNRVTGMITISEKRKKRENTKLQVRFPSHIPPSPAPTLITSTTPAYRASHAITVPMRMTMTQKKKPLTWEARDLAVQYCCVANDPHSHFQASLDEHC